MDQNNHNHDAVHGDVRSFEQQLKKFRPRPVGFDAEAIFDAIAGSNDPVVRPSNTRGRNRFHLVTASACGFAAGVLVTFLLLSPGGDSTTTNQESAVFPQEHLVHQESSSNPLQSATPVDLAIHMPLTAGNLASRQSLPGSEHVMSFHSSEHAISLIGGETLASHATPNVEQLIKELLGVRR
ncbi:hypothetical protein Rcae01_02081 [Novipirellula caenicola]|uniref:Uncharacterized protein n=2 Tax=Novipirellula caenicola TaxID=1536901 RepID=A0ABP9VQY2_9BACT